MLHEVEADEEGFVAGAVKEEDVLCDFRSDVHGTLARADAAHRVVVVGPEDPTVLLGDGFVGAGAGYKGRVHVNIVAAEVEGDEKLEEKSIVRIRRGEEAEQA